MTRRTALIVVDMQYDFMPGGALAVPGGDAVVPAVKRLIEEGDWDVVVFTQDWHPAGHKSFAASHPGRKVMETVEMPYGTQVLWPVHCVSGTRGAEIPPELTTARPNFIVRKGSDPEVDSYSAFCAADGKARTGLAGALRELGVGEIFVCGLATDFCVSFTALDGRAAGFETTVVTDASAAIDANGSLAAAREAWARAGILETTVGAVLG